MFDLHQSLLNKHNEIKSSGGSNFRLAGQSYFVWPMHMCVDTLSWAPYFLIGQLPVGSQPFSVVLYSAALLDWPGSLSRHGAERWLFIYSSFTYAVTSQTPKVAGGNGNSTEVTYKILTSGSQFEKPAADLNPLYRPAADEW